MVKGTSEQAGSTCPKEVLARKMLNCIGDSVREPRRE